VPGHEPASGTTPQAMEKAILLMERGLVNPDQVVSHRFPLREIHKAVEVMARPRRNKVIINP
jgi:threonine dehydrogenase-like Zn-dependent dehydrogenase